MFLWAGSKVAGGQSDQSSVYLRIRENDVLDRRKTETALRAGEDRAVLLGLSMVLLSVMMYFVMGITVLRSYSDSVWTDEVSCTVLNSTVVGLVNCSYSCGPECRRSSSYPCLQVYVSLNSTGRVLLLLHDEETQDGDPQCFFTPKCHRDQAAASALVHNVSERLASRHSVRCFVDPTERAYSAILRRVYDRAAVFHSLFWPTCTLIGGSAIIAMVKLTQYLSIVSERHRRIKT
ncbi:calcium-activated potassium channel subunit beta-2 isoform X2 [Nelusetta ayraudi]